MLTEHPLSLPLDVYIHKKQTNDHHVLKCSPDTNSLELAIYYNNEWLQQFWKSQLCKTFPIVIPVSAIGIKFDLISK